MQRGASHLTEKGKHKKVPRGRDTHRNMTEGYEWPMDVDMQRAMWEKTHTL
jgi:hypothetical protein